MTTLDDAVALASDDSGLAVVSTLRAYVFRTPFSEGKTR